MLLSLIMASCDRKKELIPSYLHITKFSFTTNFATQGAATSDISDVQVYANSQYMGTYELPVTIPIPLSGLTYLQLVPGIKENGSPNSRIPYVPYITYTDTIILAETRVDTVRPNTTYKPNAFFPLIEDFEDQSVSFAKSGNSNTIDSVKIITVGNPELFMPGVNSKFTGFIEMNGTNFPEIFEITSLNSYLLPNRGTDVFIELDYKTNTFVQIGIYAEKPTIYEQIPLYVLYPTDTYKKIYINLKVEVSDFDAGVKSKIFFGIYHNDVNLQPRVYLDNIKLVYLN
ncbi:MAG: hypothetical protein H7321_05210 [Bacteroidia bacterium]|nr:hypothetical protein [Bacteroidia bacterium]